MTLEIVRKTHSYNLFVVTNLTLMDQIFMLSDQPKKFEVLEAPVHCNFPPQTMGSGITVPFLLKTKVVSM